MPTTDFLPASVVIPPVNVSRLPPGSDTEHVDSWQAYLIEVACHLRQIVATDPQALETLITATPPGWWLRPPLADLVLIEGFLAAMNRYGFGDEDTAAIYLSFFTRVLGLLIIQDSARSTSVPNLAPDLSAYPTLTRLRPWLSAHDTQTTFEDALDDILTNLERDFKRKLRPLRGVRG